MKQYNRILLKLSGESLEGEKGYGIDPERLVAYTREIHAAVKLGVEVAVVIGGGNIFRGLQGVADGMDRVQGDYMGMLATLINSMALQASLERSGMNAVLLSAVAVPPICEAISRRKALAHLAGGNVVILAGGTGNPFFTTDTAAALRAVEIGADAIFKGTRVDGVYNADPEKEPKAVKFDRISFSEAYEKGLKIMDLTAFTLCRENKLPIVVFNINRSGNLARILKGEPVGTLVS
ncbi:MAG TPA: UMP kinase [Bacteroidales bacterium]|nr:UMP kinase [Bacteroidales bacterium]HPS63810.1 UMP kinase [Bacteroidales bacterium]